MEIDKYEHYSTEDFLEDDFFLEYIKTPESEKEKFWSALCTKYPERKTHLEDAIKIAQSIDLHFKEEAKQISSDQARNSFHNMMSKLEESKPEAKVIRRRFWLVAAAAIGLLLLLYTGANLSPQKVDTALTYHTGNGERTDVQLPDGSVVKLNANSTLKFDEAQWLEENIRTVWLDGEAYFDVAPTKTKTKFVVNTNEVQVVVLGTEFNLRSRSATSEVVLAEGKIELQVEDKTIPMVPGDLITYSSAQKKLESKKVKPTDYSAWKDGMAVYNDVLSEVTKELEILYGIEFIIQNNELKQRQIQLAVPADSLDQLLKTLELIYPDEISIKKDNNQIIIF
jgi:ferric-dicitrate binding protein FerR (iron transport regulator)